MKPTVIATTTWYKDLGEVRARLALNTIKEATRRGYRIVVQDRSPKYVKKVFYEAGATVLAETEKGSMGSDRRQAIQEAALMAGPEGAVIWLEPEKTPLILFLDSLSELVLNRQAELLIPRRLSLDSYPEFQQKAEWMGNKIFETLTGKALDVWFGPRIFRSDIAHYFLDYQGEYGDKWDSIFIPILRAIKDGKEVHGIGINYIHPKEQTGEEENLTMHFKRIEQLNTLAQSLRKESEILQSIQYK